MPSIEDPLVALSVGKVVSRLRKVPPKDQSMIFLGDVYASSEELAGLLNLPLDYITQLARQGIIPRANSQRGRRYPLRECLAAIIKHMRPGRATRDVELSKARVAYIDARTATEQTRLAKARGDLIEAAAVKEEWERLATELRAAMLAVSSRLGVDAATARLVDDEIRDTLTRLSLEADFSASEGEGEDDGCGIL